MPESSFHIAWRDTAVEPNAAANRELQTVRIARAAYELVLDHVSSDLTREHAGLLFGHASTGEAGLTDVISAHPLRMSSATATHVLMQREALPEVWCRLAATPQTEIVGWYHSHPGHGVFLSDTDHRTQATWFRQPWQVALVVDPILGRAGAFLGLAGREVSIQLLDR